MVLRLIRALPGVPGLIASVAGERSHKLDPSVGDQDHAISPSAPMPFVQRPSASTAFHPNVRDGRETPLDSRMEHNGNISSALASQGEGHMHADEIECASQHLVKRRPDRCFRIPSDNERVQEFPTFIKARMRFLNVRTASIAL